MNGRKFPTSKRIQKEMQKEIKEAQHLPPTPPVAPAAVIERQATATAEAILTKYPEKTAKKQREAINAMTKEMAVKKKKRHGKKSKRTSPSESIFNSSPKSIHMEGLRWIKNTTKQIIAKVNVFRRQTTKKNSSGKMKSMLRGGR